ncbi:HAD family phosphatase, partial [Streptococcus suis]
LDPSIFVGVRAIKIGKRIFGYYYYNGDVPALEEEYRVYKQKRPTPYAERIFPEVKAVLEILTIQGIPVVLASNTDRSEIERAL